MDNVVQMDRRRKAEFVECIPLVRTLLHIRDETPSEGPALLKKDEGKPLLSDHMIEIEGQWTTKKFTAFLAIIKAMVDLIEADDDEAIINFIEEALGTPDAVPILEAAVDGDHGVTVWSGRPDE